MSTYLLHDSELTPEQRRVVELGNDRHRLIIGPPGSGKTQVLAHRAAYLRQKLQTAPEKYRIFVYTRALCSFLKSAFALLEIPETSVSTFDSWCCDIYRQCIKGALPYKTGSGIDFAELHRQVRNKSTDFKTNPLFDFVLVDEAQDLDSNVVEILCNVSRHVTATADFNQQIYEDGVNEQHLLHALGLTKHNVQLLAAYRNSPYVSALASHFISDAQTRSEYLRKTQTVQSIREKPVLSISKTREQSDEILANIIQTRLRRNERLCVVVPSSHQFKGMVALLNKYGIRSQVVKPSSYDDDTPNNFDDGVTRVSTYHSVKVLTFDSVLMPWFSLARFRSSASIQQLVFVAITRATQWAFVCTEEKHADPTLQLFRSAIAEEDIEIHRDASEPKPEKPVLVPSAEEEDGSWDIDIAAF